MAFIYKRPSDLVRHFTSPGLATTAGPVPMNRYMSGSIANGGSETAKSFYGNMRTNLRRAGVKDEEVDILLKGQGSPSAMLKLMNYVIANKESLKFSQQVQHRDVSDRQTVVTDYVGSFYERYFGGGAGDLAALKKMVADKIFGVDCIGFVANWMIFAGIWDKYYGYNINQWNKIFTERVRSYDDIGDMCILVWGNSHIAIIDTVTDYLEPTRATEVVLCQSSEGGPRRDIVVLFEKVDQASGVMFDIAGTVPVKGLVQIWKKPDLRYARPVSPKPAGGEVSSPVGRWEVRMERWSWIYNFTANGLVTWRDPFSGEGGAGSWTMKPDVGQLTTAWTGSSTTETWDLPLVASGSTGRCRMKGVLYDFTATQSS